SGGWARPSGCSSTRPPRATSSPRPTWWRCSSRRGICPPPSRPPSGTPPSGAPTRSWPWPTSAPSRAATPTRTRSTSAPRGCARCAPTPPTGSSCTPAVTWRRRSGSCGRPSGSASRGPRSPTAGSCWTRGGARKRAPTCRRRPPRVTRRPSPPWRSWTGWMPTSTEPGTGLPLPEAVLVTDGGMATALEARGHDLSDALWSARLLLDAPSEIAAVHRDFFAAGADIAITASYQASFEGLAARGVDRQGAERLLRRSVELARQAAPPDGRPRWVAASVGPYGAVLADGSEYRGRYGLPVAALRDWHRPRIEVLASAGPDLLALETVPDVDEAEALVEAVAGIGVPAWLSYSVAGERTRAGQPLADAFAVAADAPGIVAVGVNCCAPADVPAAVALAREVTGKPVVAYPNSGEGWAGRWTAPSRFVAADARRWIELGARIVGGCCRVGPAQIAELAAAVGRR